METAVALAAANDNNLLWDFAMIPVGITILVIMCIAITLYVMLVVLVFSIILAVVNLVVSLVTGIGIHEMEGLYVIIDVIVVVVMVHHLYYHNASDATMQDETDSDEGEDEYIAEDEENK